MWTSHLTERPCKATYGEGSYYLVKFRDDKSQIHEGASGSLDLLDIPRWTPIVRSTQPRSSPHELFEVP
jgi:hypothetical protein